MSDILEKQLFDMNCNDCKHLERSLSERQRHVDFHYKMQKDSFDTQRMKILKAGERRFARGEFDKAKKLFNEARKMNFVFTESSCSLHYGKCLIKNKKKIISFIPETLMEENFNCFNHRKSSTSKK